ncbi:MAG: Smr/MutS family protein [Pyrinomonadaceae bacterium]
MNLLKRLWEALTGGAEERAPPAGVAPLYDDDDEDDGGDPFNPFPEPVTLEITDVFDLHSIAPRDVTRAVEAYLEEARRAGFRSVRLIHGKGIGVQREAVRKILARTPFISSYTDAPPEAGGWGATIAHLKFD